MTILEVYPDAPLIATYHGIRRTDGENVADAILMEGFDFSVSGLRERLLVMAPKRSLITYRAGIILWHVVLDHSASDGAVLHL